METCVKEEPLEMVETPPQLECSDLVYQLKSEMICEAQNVEDDFQYSREFLYAADDPTDRSLVKLEPVECSDFAYTIAGVHSGSGASATHDLQAIGFDRGGSPSTSSYEIDFHPEAEHPLFWGFRSEEAVRYTSVQDSLTTIIASLEEKLQLFGNVSNNSDCIDGMDMFINNSVSVYDDTQVPQDETDESRALRTVPASLCVYFSAAKFSGFGVWTKQHIPEGTEFGPYQGTVADTTLETCYAWKMEPEESTCQYVDASNPGLANWMRYANFAMEAAECNVMAYLDQGEVYYRTIRPIPTCAELLVWFVSGLQPCIDSRAARSRKLQLIFQRPCKEQPLGDTVWCPDCDLTFSSAGYLENHRPWCHGPNRSRVVGTKVVNHGAESREADVKPQLLFQCLVCESWFTDEDSRARHYVEHIGEKPFHCDLCWRRFYRPSDLAQHAKRHVGKKALRCNVCYEGFKDSDLLVSHMQVHDQDNPLLCEVCPQRFRLVSQLEMHSRSHVGQKLFPCRVCCKQFKDVSYLSRHMMVHTGEKPYHCDICGKDFAMASNRRRHLLIHTKERNFECSICRKRFVRPQHLTSHMRTHTGEQPYACRTCERRFSSSWSLTTHTRIHTGVKPFECGVCHKTFSNSSDRTKHQRTHTGTKLFECGTCGRKYGQPHYLARHEKLHVGTEVKPYQCDTCPKRFDLPGKLQVHGRTHTGEKPFMCDVCKNSFNLRSNLVQHLKRHTGDKAFECSVCQRRFVSSADLVRHRRIHTGEKPYQCNTCPKRFARSSHLKNHAQTHKPREKLFKCDVCHKKFTTLSNLGMHRRVHTGERPYRCDVCSKKFLQASHLKLHYRTHTGYKPYQCNICHKKFTQPSNFKRHRDKHSDNEKSDTLDL